MNKVFQYQAVGIFLNTKKWVYAKTSATSSLVVNSNTTGRLKYILLFGIPILLLFLALQACNKIADKRPWSVTVYAKETTDTVAYGYDQSLPIFFLTKDEPFLDVNILTPFESKHAAWNPNSLLGDFEEKRNRHIDTNEYWYAFQVQNYSSDSLYSLLAENDHLSIKLYCKSGRRDTLRELENMSIHGSFFNVKLPISFKSIFLLHIQSKAAASLNTVIHVASLKPANQNKGDINFKYGFIAAFLILIILSLIYFFIVTKQIRYVVLLVYLVTAISVESIIKIPPVVYIHFGRFIFFSLSVSVNLCSILFLSDRLIKNKTFYILIVLTCLQCLYPHFFSLGYGYRLIFGIGGLALYTRYALQLKRKSGNGFIIILLVLINYFWMVLFLINLFRPTGKFWYSHSTIIGTTTFFSIGVYYFIKYLKDKRARKRKEIVDQQRAISETIINTLEDERKRIAADLHDELGGNLAALKINVQYLESNPSMLSRILAMIDKASEAVRNISHNLMPPHFEETPLQDILEEYFNELNNNTVIRFTLVHTGTWGGFSKRDELMIYRIIMEMVQNAIKHAEATEVIIKLNNTTTYLEIIAEDDGKGLPENFTAGLGIKNFQSRVLFLNGELKLMPANDRPVIAIKLPHSEKV